MVIILYHTDREKQICLKEIYYFNEVTYMFIHYLV